MFIIDNIDKKEERKTTHDVTTKNNFSRTCIYRFVFSPQKKKGGHPTHSVLEFSDYIYFHVTKFSLAFYTFYAMILNCGIIATTFPLNR